MQKEFLLRLPRYDNCRTYVAAIYAFCGVVSIVGNHAAQIKLLVILNKIIFSSNFMTILVLGVACLIYHWRNVYKKRPYGQFYILVLILYSLASSFTGELNFEREILSKNCNPMEIILIILYLGLAKVGVPQRIIKICSTRNDVCVNYHAAFYICAIIIVVMFDNLLNITMLTASLYMPIAGVPGILKVLGRKSHNLAILIGMSVGCLITITWESIGSESLKIIAGMLLNFVFLISSNFLLGKRIDKKL